MLSLTFALLLVATPEFAEGPALPDDVPIHLGVTLRIADAAGLQQLLADQQNPASPRYKRWLTPAAFGERFGLTPGDYAEIAAWLTGQGFAVTLYPNRLFLEANGRVDTVRAALGVQLHFRTLGGRTFRTFDGPLQLPPRFADRVVHVSGLDTHLRLRHHLDVPVTGPNGQSITWQALGAADLRLQYDFQTLIAGGRAALGLTTAVLGTQEGTTSPQDCNNGNPGSAPFIPPSIDAISEYFTTISDATARYNPITVPNPAGDFDTCGSNQEYQLDVEMQSVGAANASAIDLVLSPASEVFETGAQYVVNNVSDAVVVSTSLGFCESEAVEFFDGGPSTAGSAMQVFQQAVQQGVAEGQTWFAAAGDTGADDCDDNNSGTGNGFNGGSATVDFPGSVPEVVDLGGTQFGATATWTAGGALAAAVPEVAWNEDADAGAAGGGGQSRYFLKPSYQKGVGPEQSDGARDVPDLALSSSIETPGVAIYDCGSGQDETCEGETSGAGALDVYGGTSIASPLAAGMFALLSGQVGCRLGDVHAELYALGNAQLDGGPQVFHDITSGNNSVTDPNGNTIVGFSAGPGYDLVTGWGTVDVAALVDHWSECSTATGTTKPASCSCSETSGASTLLWGFVALVWGMGIKRGRQRK